MAFRPGAIGDDHRRRARVQPRGVAGGDGAVLAEGRAELGQPLDGGLRTIVLVTFEGHCAVAGFDFDRHDLGVEASCRLRLAEVLLAARRPAVLVLAAATKRVTRSSVCHPEC